jgi:hypothetical protein
MDGKTKKKMVASEVCPRTKDLVSNLLFEGNDGEIKEEIDDAYGNLVALIEYLNDEINSKPFEDRLSDVIKADMEIDPGSTLENCVKKLNNLDNDKYTLIHLIHKVEDSDQLEIDLTESLKTALVAKAVSSDLVFEKLANVTKLTLQKSIERFKLYNFFVVRDGTEYIVCVQRVEKRMCSQEVGMFGTKKRNVGDKIEILFAVVRVNRAHLESSVEQLLQQRDAIASLFGCFENVATRTKTQYKSILTRLRPYFQSYINGRTGLLTLVNHMERIMLQCP